MSDYRQILTQVLTLTPEEQIQLVSELLPHIHRQVIPKPKRSILELEGLGKQIWNHIDAQEYVNQERNSWSRS